MNDHSIELDERRSSKCNNGIVSEEFIFEEVSIKFM